MAYKNLDTGEELCGDCGLHAFADGCDEITSLDVGAIQTFVRAFGGQRRCGVCGISLLPQVRAAKVGQVNALDPWNR